MAGEDLISHLDGDVTQLSPLVQVHQVGSEARRWFKYNLIWREVEMNNEKEQCDEVCVCVF